MSSIEWETYDKIKSNQDLFITVTPTKKHKRIYINSKATEVMETVQENFRWVKVGFDNKENNFIIKPLSERKTGALRVNDAPGDDNTPKLIIKAQLVEKIRNKAHINSAARFKARWDENNEFLVVDLNETHDDN